MGYVILFCLLVGHGLLANVLERRPQLGREEVSNIKTNLNSQKSVHKLFTETNDSTRNHPTDDFNKQIADYDTETAPVERVGLTNQEEEVLETSLDRRPAVSKRLGTKLSPYRALKKFLRRLLIGSKQERGFSSKVGASSSRAEENSVADNTKRISRIKSDVMHSKRTGLKGKFQAEFRRDRPAAGHLEDALISAFMRRYSRRIFDAIVARYDEIVRRELRRIAQEARRDRSVQIATDRETGSNGEALRNQMPYPRSESSFDAPPVAYQDKDGSTVAYQDKDGPTAVYQDTDGPTVAYRDEYGPPAVYQDKDEPPVAYQDKDGPPVAYQDKDGPPAVIADVYDELRQDGSDSPSGGSFDEWPMREMEAVEVDRMFRRLRRDVAGYPGASTAAPMDVMEDPASEPGNVVGVTEPQEEQHAMVGMTTPAPPSKMPVVLGLLGGMVLGAVLATIIIVIYLKVSKKKEQEPLKPGAAPASADKAAKDIAATASHAALKDGHPHKTPSKAGKPHDDKHPSKDHAKLAGGKHSTHNAPGHPPAKK